MKIKQIINNCAKFNHWLFSSQCLLCAASTNTGKDVCQDCFDALPWHTAPHCQQCGLLSNHPICGHCLKEPLDFDATFAALRYEFPLDALMQQYKYGSALQTARLFAQLMITHHTLHNIDVMIPMPLHPQRLQERGFNQSLEIAKLLAKQSNIPLDYTSCTRTKYTPPQASLPLKERAKNIKGVFACSANLAGKRIAIVDDVMTTGASLNELSKTLKKAGAAHVECWVVARTLQKY
ncbi:MAG TPA: ComF family protein [Methylotenera sp.]|nr:ComF family protein [Methylotenera sp.]HPH05986.1 ComF family protein [Methylotenera sp.]HPN00564.1 ComF family protein [Methylotenera sp.]